MSFSVFINTDTQRKRGAKGDCQHLTTIFLAAIWVHSRTKIHTFGRGYVRRGECWVLSVWPSKSVLTAFSLPPPTMHCTHLLRQKYHRPNLHCHTKALKTTHTSKAKYNFMLYEHQRVETLWYKVSVESVDRCVSVIHKNSSLSNNYIMWAPCITIWHQTDLTGAVPPPRPQCSEFIGLSPGPFTSLTRAWSSFSVW